MELFDLTSYIVDMVYDYVPNIRRAGANKLNFKCPLCGDGKKNNSHRGWFFTDNATYVCYNAGCIAFDKALSGIKFLSLVSGESYDEIKKKLMQKAKAFNARVDKRKNDFSLFDDEDKFEKTLSIDYKDKLDSGEWTAELPKFVKDYLDKRKLFKAPFLKKDYTFFFDKKEKRLVIPWTNDYYQERALFSKQLEKGKYLFPPNVKKPIFGLDNIDKSFKYIFLLEGVFDSIWVKNGVAVGSLRMSSYQKEILKEYEKDYTLVFMPDNQFCDKSSFEETLKFCKNNPFSNIFIWPKQLKKWKDVNETVMFSDRLVAAWKSEEFLKKNVMNGLKGIVNLQ